MSDSRRPDIVDGDDFEYPSNLDFFEGFGEYYTGDTEYADEIAKTTNYENSDQIGELYNNDLSDLETGFDMLPYVSE